MTDQEKENDPIFSRQEEEFSLGKEESPENWQDDLPPEDDFSDAAQTVEEEIMAEEIEEDSGEKRRGKTVLFGVLGVAILLVGGMVVLQSGLLGGGSKKGPELPPLALKTDAFQKPAEVPDLATLYQAEQAVHQNVDALASLSGNGAEQEGNKESLGVGTDIVTLTGGETPPLAPVADAPAPAEPLSPPPPSIAKVEDVPVAPLDLAPAPPQAAAPEPALVPEPALKEDGRVAELEARLAEMASQLEAAKLSLAQAESRTSELLDKLEALQKEPKKPEAKKPAPSKTVAKTKKAEKKAAAAPKAPKAKTPQKPKKEEGWTLRAATPEAVWVSKGRDSAELRRVAVGETLPGIGKIKEIRQKDDVWEVVGASGVLK